MDTSLSELLHLEIKRGEALFAKINKELQLSQYSFQSFLESTIKQEIIYNKKVLSIFAFPKQVILTKEVKVSPESKDGIISVTPELASTSFSAKDIQKSLGRMGVKQRMILIKVYWELEATKLDKVRLSLAKWLGNESNSNSDRASWSKSLAKLIERKLIVKSFTDDNLLSKPNTGNSIAYVSLTPLGLMAAKWLINNNLGEQTG